VPGLAADSSRAVVCEFGPQPEEPSETAEREAAERAHADYKRAQRETAERLAAACRAPERNE
jgi:hypothetical protein